MRNVRTDKAVNKDARITVRLTPHQEQELNTISGDLKMSRSALLRRVLDKFIGDYYQYLGYDQ